MCQFSGGRHLCFALSGLRGTTEGPWSPPESGIVALCPRIPSPPVDSSRGIAFDSPYMLDSPAGLIVQVLQWYQPGMEVTEGGSRDFGGAEAPPSPTRGEKSGLKRLRKNSPGQAPSTIIGYAADVD